MGPEDAGDYRCELGTITSQPATIINFLVTGQLWVRGKEGSFPESWRPLRGRDLIGGVASFWVWPRAAREGGWVLGRGAFIPGQDRSFAPRLPVGPKRLEDQEQSDLTEGVSESIPGTLPSAKPENMLRSRLLVLLICGFIGCILLIIGAVTM